MSNQIYFIFIRYALCDDKKGFYEPILNSILLNNMLKKHILE